MQNVNIYVVHYTKLVKREPVFAKIQTMFGEIVKKSNISLNLKIISKFDPESLNGEFVKRIFDSNEDKDEKVALYNKYIIKTPQANFISNSLKHMDAFNQIVKTSSDEDINIVVEDDVVFETSSAISQIIEFVEKKKYMKDGTTSHDIVFFGLPGLSTEAKSDSLSVFTVDDVKVLPSCDSYFITKACAKKLSQHYIPLKFPNNIHLSYLITKHSLSVGRTSPNIMADGSKIGTMSSSISPNNILIFNSTYKQIYSLLDKKEPSFDDITKIEELFKGNALKNSPDFVFLEGLFFLRTKRYPEAKTKFDSAISLYEQELSPLSNQSAIIQNYIDLCKHIQ